MKPTRTLYFVGIGMGNPDTMTVEAQKAIRASDALIGAKRMTEPFEALGKPILHAYKDEDIVAFIREHEEYSTISILFSGDTGFYSGAKPLYEQLQDCTIRTICGISSVQYLCAKLGVPWEDAELLSLHGRAQNLIAAVRRRRKVFALTGGENSVQNICRMLCDYGYSDVMVAVGEHLSYGDERITKDTAEQLQAQSFHPLSVVLIVNPHADDAVVTHGLPDEAFLRTKVPMTKSEVRSVSLSRLELCETDVVYDIGAGTGSIAVEAALQIGRGTVYAIEKGEAALELLEQNRQRFACPNLQIITGTAPEALADLPAPDKVFIGGTSGRLADIVAALLAKNPSVRMVLNAIALETLSAALRVFEEQQMEVLDIAQISVAKAKAVGGYRMMTAHNPVFILTAQRRKAHD